MKDIITGFFRRKPERHPEEHIFGIYHKEIVKRVGEGVRVQDENGVKLTTAAHVVFPDNVTVDEPMEFFAANNRELIWDLKFKPTGRHDIAESPIPGKQGRRGLPLGDENDITEDGLRVRRSGSRDGEKPIWAFPKEGADTFSFYARDGSDVAVPGDSGTPVLNPNNEVVGVLIQGYDTNGFPPNQSINIGIAEKYTREKNN